MAEGTRTGGGIASVVEGGTRNKLLVARVGKALDSAEIALTRQEASWVINDTEGRRSGRNDDAYFGRRRRWARMRG
jgi:hypothetical protein